MNAEANAQWEEICAITQAAGDSLMRSDLKQIKRILGSMAEEDRLEMEPCIWEGLWLTWAAPSYKGDIKRLR